MAAESLNNLSKLTTCAVCEGSYSDPLVLPCCHYFCKNCLHRLLVREGIVCPICNEVCQCEGLEQLPRVVFVSRLQELQQQLSALEGGQCGLCSESGAHSYCKDCGELVCSDCVTSHRKMKAKFGEHVVVSMTELRDGIDILLKPKPRLCPDHDEVCKIHCINCNQLICRDCTVIDHSDHQFDFVKKSAIHLRKTLQEESASLTCLSSKVEQAVKRIQDAKLDIQQQHDFVQEHIRHKFSEMMAVLQARERELLAEMEQVMQHKLTVLETHERSTAHKAMRVNSRLSYIQHNLHMASDEDLLTAQRDLKHKLAEGGREEEASLPSPEDANIAVKIVALEELRALVSEKTSVYEFPISEEVHLADVGTQTTQYVRDPQDSYHLTTTTAAASLRSIVDGSTVNATVTKTGKGLYEVTYTPVVRGRHELHMTINSEPIAGGPRLVFASIPPTQLGPLPLKTLPGFKHPFAVQFDSHSNLLVTEASGMKVTRLSREGEPLTKNGHFLELSVPSPSGLAIHPTTGAVYVASKTSNTLFKYSRRGKLLCQSVGVDMDQPSGVTLVKDQLFVCDRNRSQVTVFDHNLKYIRSFGSHGNKHGQLCWPYDIVGTEAGNVIVSDSDNHRLQEFTPQGEPVTCYHGNLKRPMGLCLSKTGHMYVTEFEKHQLNVLDKNGKWVWSLGKYGTREGEMCYPTGVAIDNDGFVYVCDQGNNRVLVY